MILSHAHRFIFLKTNKTAGTSVEIALSRFCGPHDVITPIATTDEATRRQLAYRGAQHHELPLREHCLKDIFHVLRSGMRRNKFYNHIPAAELQRCSDEQTWSEYFKFTIERNPWDRFVSYYYWRTRHGPRPSIRAFLETDEPVRLKQRGIELYTIDGRVAVDKVCLFERLTEDLEEVRTRLGLPEPLVLPHAKATTRTDRRHYREILDDYARDKIAELFADEIRTYGYRF